MDPGYLDYLEHSSTADTSPDSLIRLAAAIETTADSLRGGTVERSPGPGRAGPHPTLDPLSREQCGAHLAGGGVGRFLFLAERGPLALSAKRVGFEVDHIDEAMSEGWSVRITGRARLVNDRAELEQLARLGMERWPGGRRDAVIRVETAQISGRSIRQQG